MGARRATSAVLLLAAGLACACAGHSAARSGAADDAVTPPRFVRLASLLRRGRTAAQTGDASAMHALRQPLANEGLALLRARIPHDLRRQDVPRFLSARRQFGEALGRWVAALDAGDADGTRAAFRDVDDAAQGWIDAYLGRPTETAI